MDNETAYHLQIYREETVKFVNKAIEMYEDGETGVEGCVEQYCEFLDIEQSFGEEAVRIYMIEEAVGHGIPRAVAEGKMSLRDFFSQEYINRQVGR